MIAYFILVHRFPNQFIRLFKAIYDPTNIYLIHIDKGSDPVLFATLNKFLKPYLNVNLLESQKVVWGGYSMVEAELRAMYELLSMNKNWQYFINLSGQDFPLKSQTYIKKFLNSRAGDNFMLYANQATERPNTMNRIENYFDEVGDSFVGRPIKRKYLDNVTPYIGGQWKVLTRKCCEFVCNNNQLGKFETFYRHTLIADESFFQTLLLNTSYRQPITNNDLRAIIWVPDVKTSRINSVFNQNTTNQLVASGKIKLRPKTYTIKDENYLFNSQALFARKFDESVDSKIIEKLEQRLKN